ncbi:MAG: hypothetical protein A2046_09930 [Bacteroidetes bacterium GWA2_30_7]|nr:MAG: hypothetical protein A2046_09930 [Bacteroidetes bacterium GWA2_30_7]
MKNKIKSTLMLCCLLAIAFTHVNAQLDTATCRKEIKDVLEDAKNSFAINQGEFAFDSEDKYYQYYTSKTMLGGNAYIQTQQNISDSGKVLVCFYDWTNTDILLASSIYLTVILEELNAMNETWKYRAKDYTSENGNNVTELTDMDYNYILEVISFKDNTGMTIKFYSKGIANKKNNANAQLNPIIFPSQRYNISNLDFSLDGKIAVASAGELELLGTKMMMGSTNIYNINKNEIKSTSAPSVTVIFSPDGNKFLTSVMPGGLFPLDVTEYNVNDTNSLALTELIQNDFAPYSLLYSADGNKIITTCSGGLVYIFDKPTKKLLKSIKIAQNDGEYVEDMFILKNNKTLITTCKSLLQYWDLESGNELKKLTSDNGAFSSCAISADQKTMITNDEKLLKIWDIEKGEIKTSFETIEPFSSAVSPDGSLIALGYRGGFYVYNNTGKLLKTYIRTKLDTFNALAFSPDGKYLAVGTNRGELVLFSNSELTQ